jgi:hypothetical protein
MNLLQYGAKIHLYHGDKYQFKEFYPVHGYLSSLPHEVHFGLGQDTMATVQIQYPGGGCGNYYNLAADSSYFLSFQEHDSCELAEISQKLNIFQPVRQFISPPFKHQENEFNDFEYQPLIRKKYSQLGPGIAVADVDNDGLDDFFISGALNQDARIYRQTESGNFELHFTIPTGKYEDMGAVFFDADQDGDSDLYVAGGGVEYNDLENRYLDRLYLNDGNGMFSYDSTALPVISTSSFCVNVADFDADQDLDVFVGGRINLRDYPATPGNYLLINESTNGNTRFINATEEFFPELSENGMVSSALWTDFNNDGLLDLIVVGEWMPISVYQQTEGGFQNVTGEMFSAPVSGWWNSINGGDFDKDGDMDYVVGNLGLNAHVKTSKNRPVSLVAEDFDNDGQIDPVVFRHYEDKLVPLHTRDVLVNQLGSWKSVYPDYNSYAEASTLIYSGYQYPEQNH